MSTTTSPDWSPTAELYAQRIPALLHDLLERNGPVLRKLGPLIAENLAQGGVLHTFGSGHSEIIGKEIVGRAGGLVCISAIPDPTAGFVENLPGYGRELGLRYDRNHGLEAGEFIIVISNSGKNASPVEIALLAKEKGLRVIALTSLKMAASVSSRHPSGKKLHEVADHVLDNGGEIGDAIVPLPGHEVKAGATSTIAGAYLLNLLQLEVIAALQARGVNPPVLLSQNLEGAMDTNRALARKYGKRLSKPL